MESWRGFGSDNHSGVHPEVLSAIAEANVGHAHAYGDDPWTVRADRSAPDGVRREVAGRLRLQRHRRQRRGALGGVPAVGERHLRRERAHRHRRVRCARAHRQRQARHRAHSRRQADARARAAVADRVRVRAPRAAQGHQRLERHRARHRLHARPSSGRSPTSRTRRACCCTSTARESPTRRSGWACRSRTSPCTRASTCSRSAGRRTACSPARRSCFSARRARTRCPTCASSRRSCRARCGSSRRSSSRCTGPTCGAGAPRTPTTMATMLAIGARARGIEIAFPVQANEVFALLPDELDPRAAGAVPLLRVGGGRRRGPLARALGDVVGHDRRRRQRVPRRARRSVGRATRYFGTPVTWKTAPR